jgi:hypothetical protein
MERGAAYSCFQRKQDRRCALCDDLLRCFWRKVYVRRCCCLGREDGWGSRESERSVRFCWRDRHCGANGGWRGLTRHWWCGGSNRCEGRSRWLQISAWMSHRRQLSRATAGQEQAECEQPPRCERKLELIGVLHRPFQCVHHCALCRAKYTTMIEHSGQVRRGWRRPNE